MATRNRLFAVVTLPIGAAVLVAGAWFATAGDLNPPVGPVTPTYKTLTEVEPRTAVSATNTPGDADSLFKITQRGSYYLTGNVTGVVGKHGIEIVASGVTLDLNGFDLLGIAGSLDGVSTTVASLTNLAVINGSVRNWGDEGIDLAINSPANCRVAGLLASGNAGNGIAIGQGGTASNCSAYLNGVNGILVGNGCTVTHCSAYQNTGSGIITGSGCTVAVCSVRLNSLVGISVVASCTVVDCSAQSNTLDGIACISACIIRSNTCSVNGNGAGDGAGINAVSNDNRIEGNNCTGADRGIDIDSSGNIVIKNTCSGNAINWVIVANNVCGPILDRTAPASAAISGNSAVDSTGSTHPNANFSY
ncbi:MAG: hypothetical protein AABZ08_13410 [Planctomycetota bacterium]